jgi:hypothetical protein
MQQLSQVEICNLSLMQIGQNKIQSITNQNDPNAVACNVAWSQAFGSVARETPWNCLKAIASLGQAIIPNPASATYGTNIPSTATTWTPGTNYAVNAYVIYAGYLYQCLIANTASASFTVDLTKGYWFQTNTYSPSFFGVPAGNTVSGAPWSYAYTLPADFIALVSLNGGGCWSGWGWWAGWGGTSGWQGGNSSQGQPHEIYGRYLYTNAALANIVYVQYQTDTTIYDSLFTDCLVLKLSAMIATHLRKDDMGISQTLAMAYRQRIQDARVKNAGDDRLKRFNPISSSRFVQARRRSTNG